MMGRSTVLILGNTLVSAVLGFFALKAFAVGTGEYADALLGQLAFAMAIAGLGSMALDLGFGSAHVKRVSEGRGLADATASLALAKLALAAVFVLGVLVAAFTAAGTGLLQDTPRVAVVAAALFFAFNALRGIFTSTFDGRREFAKTQLTLLVESLVRVPLFVLFAVAFAGAVRGIGPLAGWLQGPGAWTAALVRDHSAVLLTATYTASALASFLAGALLFSRGYAVGKPRRAVLVDYWRFGRHIFVAVVVGAVYVNLDKVVITTFWAASNTGQYFAAQRFSDLLVMVPAAVYAVMFPSLSHSFAQGDDAEARRSLEAALRHVSLVVVPLGAFLVVMAGPVLSVVLTGVFTGAVPTLRLLAVFATLLALSYPLITLLHARGRPDVAARVALLGMLLNVVLNLALVPPPGALLGLPTAGMAEVGAALATVLAAGVQFALVYRAARREHGPVPLVHTAKHVVAAAVAGAVLWPLAPRPEVAPFWLVGALALLGLAVYLGVLALLREFTRKDAALYLDLLHPARMVRHVAGQVRSQGPGERRPPLP